MTTKRQGFGIPEVTTDDKKMGKDEFLKTKNLTEKPEEVEKSAVLKSDTNDKMLELIRHQRAEDSAVNESVARVDGKNTIKIKTISRLSETSNDNLKKESKEETVSRISGIMEAMDNEKHEAKKDESGERKRKKVQMKKEKGRKD